VFIDESDLLYQQSFLETNGFLLEFKSLKMTSFMPVVLTFSNVLKKILGAFTGLT